ncbi:unnamed protein product [Closterium sp. NIES-53]
MASLCASRSHFTSFRLRRLLLPLLLPLLHILMLSVFICICTRSDLQISGIVALASALAPFSSVSPPVPSPSAPASPSAHSPSPILHHLIHLPDLFGRERLSGSIPREPRRGSRSDTEDRRTIGACGNRASIRASLAVVAACNNRPVSRTTQITTQI